MTKKNIIHGYKIFNSDFTNRFNKKFEVGRQYVVEDRHRDYLYHYCQYLEDIFVYYDSFGTIVCKVVGSGITYMHDIDYYGVYGVCASSELLIERIMSREEIISYFLNMTETMRIKNFIIRFKLTDEEVNLFLNIFAGCSEIVSTIEYYQLNKKSAYILARKKSEI